MLLNFSNKFITVWKYPQTRKYISHIYQASQLSNTAPWRLPAWGLWSIATLQHPRELPTLPTLAPVVWNSKSVSYWIHLHTVAKLKNHYVRCHLLYSQSILSTVVVPSHNHLPIIVLQIQIQPFLNKSRCVWQLQTMTRKWICGNLKELLDSTVF